MEATLERYTIHMGLDQQTCLDLGSKNTRKTGMLGLMDQQNPYSFFLDSKPQKKVNLPSTKHRILIVFGLVAVLCAAGVVLMNVLNAGSKNNAENFYVLIAGQSDLIDLAKIGAQKARDPQLQQLAANSEVLYTSQNQATIALMDKQGIKLDKKKVALYRNDGYKKALDDAETSGKFDASYAAILTQRVDAYRNTLQTAYAGQKSQSVKKELANQYAAVGLLIKRESGQAADNH